MDLDEDEAEPQTVTQPLLPLSPFAQHVATYIGGFLLRSASGAIKCETCKLVVLHYATDDAMTTDALIRWRDRGGLFFPSSDVSRICFVCEAAFQETVNPVRASITVLQHQAFMHLRGLFSSLEQHFIFFPQHFHSLLDLFTRRYFVLRKHHAIRLLNNRNFHQRTRFVATKAVIFRGE